jgi:hypothetical protein
VELWRLNTSDQENLTIRAHGSLGKCIAALALGRDYG